MTPLMVGVAAGAGLLAFAGSSMAAVASVSGGAFGEQVNITITDISPFAQGPAPTVTLPPAGGSFMQAGTSTNAGPGGLFLRTGALGVSTQGTTGAAGTVTSSATVATPNVLETLQAQAVASTCTVSETASTAATTISAGTLLNADGSTTALPATPGVNQTFTGTNADTGDQFRVILNQQQTAGGVLTVNAVNFELLGPTATGFVILGQSRCGVSAAATTTTGGTTATTGGSNTTQNTTATGSVTDNDLPRTGRDAPLLAVAALVVGALATFRLARRRTG